MKKAESGLAEVVLALLAVTAAAAEAGEAGDKPGALPEGAGLAAKYLGDAGIAGDPAVVFTDDFEDYAESPDLRRRWNFALWDEGSRLVCDDPQNVHGGKKSVEFSVKKKGEVGHGAIARFEQGYDTLFVRYYIKFDRNDDFFNSAHDGACLAALAPDFPPDRPFSAGTRADGRNKFIVSLDTWRLKDMKPVPPPPGEWVLYLYHPDQRGDYGDNLYTEPKFYVERDRWYCSEIMLQANTPGKRDGRIAFWADGALVGDFPGLRLRDVADLKINFLSITLYIGENKHPNAIWYDDLVTATAYIGPKTEAPPPSGEAALSPEGAGKPGGHP